MRIAIVGGIGSGKSEVLRTAREMGVACLSADEINAELLKDSNYIAKLKQIFPNVVKNGNVDKAELAADVFSDRNKRKRLNELAHPIILQRISENKSNPIVVEMPLIIESGAADIFDEIVLVSAPLFKRLRRLKNRGVSYSRALKVIKAQVSESELRHIATSIISNNGSIDDLRTAAKELIEIFCK